MKPRLSMLCYRHLWHRAAVNVKTRRKKKDDDLHIGSGTVDGLEDGSISTNVSRGGKTESTDKTGAHVRENVTVKVRGDKDGVLEGSGVLDDLK